MRIALIAISPEGKEYDVAEVRVDDMPITDERDGPKAKALVERVNAVCRYAREHVIVPSMLDVDGMAPDPDPQQILSVGPLRCVFLHTRSPAGDFRQLHIGISGARTVEQLPPPVACAVIAKMFGFTGKMNVDYLADIEECPCGKPGCAGRPVVACIQKLPEEN